ncbi:WxcM-like domain-containing protein [Blastococcus saxobsidens]|uniref:WxcM-like domain-containing protein n=1 Tax=Blastococcus saxobsidens TaxID=138336 RepID=UPI001A91A29C|nr:WxcM-like domain-containing protein [Blastococcus saxobsidens]
MVLDRPDIGLHMAPMIWGTQYRCTADAVLVVLAFDPYDPDDYIRDHDEYLAEVRAGSWAGGDSGHALRPVRR